MTGTTSDPLAGLQVDQTWNRDPAQHPEWAPWSKLQADWTPEGSLTRIESKAAFVFGNVALVGTLAAGLGLVTDLKLPASLQWLVILAGILLVIALTLALLATMPSWRSSIPVELNKLKAVYENWISVRGWLVRLSLLAYAAAFVAGIALVVCSLNSLVEPSLSLATATKNNTVAVTGTVTAQSLDGATAAKTTLIAVVDGKEQTLAQDIRKAGATSSLSIALTADPPPAATSFKLQVYYQNSSNTTITRTIELTP